MPDLHEDHDADGSLPCAAVLIAADGTPTLVCRHTRKPLAHVGPLRIAYLHYDPADPKASLAMLSFVGPVRVLADLPPTGDDHSSSSCFDLHGGVIHVPGCTCGDVVGVVPDEPAPVDHGH